MIRNYQLILSFNVVNDDLFYSLVGELDVKKRLFLVAGWNEHSVVDFRIELLTLGFFFVFEAFLCFEHGMGDGEFAVFDEHLELVFDWDDLTGFVF
jgi:hypothetical protein